MLLKCSFVLHLSFSFFFPWFWRGSTRVDLKFVEPLEKRDSPRVDLGFDEPLEKWDLPRADLGFDKPLERQTHQGRTLGLTSRWRSDQECTHPGFWRDSPRADLRFVEPFRWVAFRVLRIAFPSSFCSWYALFSRLAMTLIGHPTRS